MRRVGANAPITVSMDGVQPDSTTRKWIGGSQPQNLGSEGTALGASSEGPDQHMDGIGQ